MCDIKVDEEIASLLPKPTAEERDGLRIKLEGEGCRDALVVWHETGILLDGHNRKQICDEHGIKYSVHRMKFPTRALAVDWVIDNQLGRRNLTDERRAYFRGKKYLNQKQSADDTERLENAKNAGSQSGGQNVHRRDKTAETIAKVEGTNEKTVRRDAEFAEAVDAAEEVQPGAREQILSGTSGMTKQDIVACKPMILCDRCKRIGAARGCEQCKELRKAAKKGGGIRKKTVEPLSNGEQEKKPETVEEEMEAKNKEIESYCRKLKAIIDEMPQDPWISDMGRRDGVIRKIEDACSSLRAAKCSKICPRCKGTKMDGGKKCSPCHGTGRVRKIEYDQMV